MVNETRGAGAQQRAALLTIGTSGERAANESAIPRRNEDGTSAQAHWVSALLGRTEDAIHNAALAPPRSRGAADSGASGSAGAGPRLWSCASRVPKRDAAGGFRFPASPAARYPTRSRPRPQNEFLRATRQG